MSTVPRLALIAACALVASGPRAEEPKPDEVAHVGKAFEDVARSVFTGLLARAPADLARDALAVMGGEEKDLPEKLARFFLDSAKHAFAVSAEQAKAMAHGTFNDAANRSSCDASAKVLAELGVPVPELLEYLIEKVQTREFHGGFELEFATRVLRHHADKAKSAIAAMEAKPEQRAAPGGLSR